MGRRSGKPNSGRISAPSTNTITKKKKPTGLSVAASKNRLYNAFDIAEAELESKRRHKKRKERGAIDTGKNGGDDDDSDPNPLDGSNNPIDPSLIAGQDVDEDEDEEIDSDEAFGSSDEEEILDSKSWQKKRKQFKNKYLKGEDNESSEESEEEEDTSQWVSLTEAWDLDDKDQKNWENSQVKGLDGKSQDIQLQDSDDEESEDEDSDDDDDDDDDSDDDQLSLNESDYDDIDESKLSSLQEMISGLTKPSKASITASESNVKKNKISQKDLDILQQSSLAPESEFSAINAGSASSTKLSLADLAGTIDDEDASSHLALIDTSATDKDTDPNGNTRKKSKSQTLSVPLPRHIQQRHDRKAAYELTKEEVKKWVPTVKSMAMAEHISFPLVEPKSFDKEEDDEDTKKINPLELSIARTSSTNAADDMEAKIQALLQQSNLVQKSAQPDTFEELAPSQLTLEELQAQRTRLRRMRELAYREEKKARRIKKIKSKTYRKIHRKERERDEEHMREALGSDYEGSDPEDDEEHDIRRAQERMSQKHKTKNKWAKDMIKHGMTKDKATRNELEEMLKTSEALRAKMLGKKSLDEDSDMDSDDEQRFIGQDDDEDGEGINAEKEGLGKGVLAMKFMRDAEEAERKRNQLAKEELRRAMGELDSEDEDNEHNGSRKAKGANVIINEGRRVYAPGTAKARSELKKVQDDVERDEMELNEESGLDKKLSKAHAKRKRQSEDSEEDEDEEFKTGDSRYGKVRRVDASDSESENGNDDEDDESDDDANPWLTGEETTKKKSTVTVLSKDSSAYDKSQNSIQKQRKKASKKSKGSSRDGLIDMNETLTVVDAYGSDNDVSGSDQETMVGSEKKHTTGSKDKKVKFKQTDLVKEAFAGDDVVTEFEAEKAETVTRDDDRVEDVTLPGWGCWDGADMDGKKKPKKKFIRKVAGVVQAKNRKDFGLKNVILNERVTTGYGAIAGGKLQAGTQATLFADKLPFLYSNAEEYEKSLRIPIGQEFVSRTVHQKMVKPRVLVKPNVVIEAIRNPFEKEDSD